MSLIKAIKAQLGLSVTPGNNFTLDASADNGTMKLARNSGQDIMTVAADGKVAFPQGGGLVPSGAVMDFAMAAAPDGWLICNGALVSRTTYAALFSAIGTTYGAGDGSTTFAVPNLAGKFRRMLGGNAGVLGATQNSGVVDHRHFSLMSGNGAFGWATAGGAYNAPAGGSLNLEGNTYTGGLEAAAGLNETRPFNMAFQTCIKT